MDIRDILKSFDQLSEATTATDKGTVHKAGAGGYGNKHGTDDVTDQYGKPVGRVSLGKLGAQNEPKRGKGRPPNPDKAKEYDSSALNKAMGIGKAPKPTGKPSVKHSLKEYFDQMDEALSEAGLTVQPIPASKTPGQSFMIKDPADPQSSAITTSDPAVVDAAKKGTLSMQKPGAAPTTTNATPTSGAGSQVGAMAEGGDVGKHNNATTGFDALVRKLTPKYGKEAATKIAGAQLKKMSEGEMDEAAKYRDPKYKDRLYTQEPLDHTFGPDMDAAYYNNYPDDYEGRKRKIGGGEFSHNDPLRKGWGRGGASNSINTHGKRAGMPSRDQITSLKGSIKDAHGQHARPNLPEAEAPQHFAQSSPLSTANRGVLESKKGVNPFAKKDESDKKKLPSMAHIKKMCQDGKSLAEICKMHPDCDRAELKKMVADCKKTLDEGSMPMKKVDGKSVPAFAADGKGKNDLTKKSDIDSKRKSQVAAAGKAFNDADEYKKSGGSSKQKVKEGMEHHLQAARLEGKSHALRKMPYNCTHDNMEEARCYHDGFKEGLDECYGQMPILGRTAVDEMGSEVGAMASYGARTPAMEDDMYEMDKTAYMKQQAIKTPGDTFKAFGQTMSDKDVLDEFAFESLDKQLSALLESEVKVAEGMTVSISKGQQGSPDSVSVSAQDGEADQLLSIIKSAGMGLFGGEDKGFSSTEGSAGAHGGISVVDDHDGMMSLMKKLSGNGAEASDGDYESEEGHSHDEEDSCNECGMAYESCGCDHSDQEIVDEVESEDQMTAKVAEDNPPDNGSANSTNDTHGNDAANTALAISDKKGPIAEEDKEHDNDEHECEKCHSDPCKCKDKEEVEEGIYESYANSADDTFEADIEFMTKIISGGLNKQKSTGQTTVPIIAGQGVRVGVDGKKDIKESAMLNESVNDWKKLAGIK
jgi:hypothetical protein